jgi:hypothetical protein
VTAGRIESSFLLGFELCTAIVSSLSINVKIALWNLSDNFYQANRFSFTMYMSPQYPLGVFEMECWCDRVVG